MINKNKNWKFLAVTVCGLLTLSATLAQAASPAKQLAKGIMLYDQNKNDDAMEYFVDVLVNGNQDEVAIANRYVNLIHDRVGGIQKPVEVDVNFKEGEVRRLDEQAQAAAEAAQEEARKAAEEAALQAQAAQEQAALQAQAKAEEALAAVDAQQQALAQQIEAQRQAAANKVAAQSQAMTDSVAATAGSASDDLAAIAAAASAAGLSTQLQDEQAMQTQAAQQAAAADAALDESQAAAQQPASVFMDLTSPQAIEARELYTQQKLASMTDEAITKIKNTSGVHLYMRDERPDALDIEPEVLFEKGQFRTDALPLLNSIYELLALTQGSAYVILPPGSYTDDVTLSGIRQAMALNSYLINRGISQGKLHYNMGLADQEPPARFANLNGVAIVFDYDAKLPTSLEQNENNEQAPLLSMAIVPLCHAIDRSLGEAFAIDFSVLETVNPLDNWLLQVVQHGRDGKFYVVRQLEGFAPVYHQILWNGRKGIIGPELPCGKYTLVLTATDLKGQQQTLRRRVIVKCNEQVAACQTEACGAKKVVAQAQEELDYKTTRLWVKPGRKMYKTVTPAAAATGAVSQQSTTTSHATSKVTTKTIIQEYDGEEPAADSASAIAPLPAAPADDLGGYPANNPYDMPYEEQ